jgi:hypothetical protein
MVQDEATGGVSKVFRVTRSNKIFNSVVGIIGVPTFACIAALTLSHTGNAALLVGLGSGIFAVVIACMVTNSMMARLELRRWVLDYRGLLGRRLMPIKDIASMQWGGGRGFLSLTIRDSQGRWIMVSNHSFSDATLKEIEEYIYLGADETANSLIRRPIRQLREEEIPQRRPQDIPQRRF